MSGLLEGKVGIILGIANRVESGVRHRAGIFARGRESRAHLSRRAPKGRRGIAGQRFESRAHRAMRCHQAMTTWRRLRRRCVLWAVRSTPWFTAWRSPTAKILVATVCGNRPRRISHGPGSERLLAGGGGARGRAGHDRGRFHHDADVPRLDARGAELQRDGRGQSRARSVGPVSGQRSGSAKDPRERHLSGTGEDRLRARDQRFFDRFWTWSPNARRCGAIPIPRRSAMPRCSWRATSAAASPATCSSSIPECRLWGCDAFVSQITTWHQTM